MVKCGLGTVSRWHRFWYSVGYPAFLYLLAFALLVAILTLAGVLR